MVSLGKAEELKRVGNQLFSDKKFHDAISLYKKAIALQTSCELAAVYHGNIAACYSALEDWDNAINSSRDSIALNPNYVKGHYRLAYALEKKSSDLSSIITAAAAGLALHPTNKDLLCIMRSAKLKLDERDKDNKDSAKNSAFSKMKHTDSHHSNEYTTSDETTIAVKVEHKHDVKELQSTLKGLIGADHYLDGVFTKLIHGKTYKDILYAGLSEEQFKYAPQSFKELVKHPFYASDLPRAVKQAKEKALRVLAGVKKRGQNEGQTMDPETESLLFPQIYQEAFAREVISMVRNVHAREHALIASNPSNLANPDADEASWNQLSEDAVSKLSLRNIPSEKKVIIDGFLGEEWPVLVKNDCMRFASSGHIQISEKSATTAWLESPLLETTYPALHELVRALHGLPYELNKKILSLRLSRPLRGSTMLVRIPKGSEIHRNFGITKKFMESHTGCKITAVYYIGEKWHASMGGIMKLTVFNESVQGSCENLCTEFENSHFVIDPLPDRLVLFRTKTMYSEQMRVESDEMWFVTFWLHGAENQFDS